RTLIKSALIASALIPTLGLVANDSHADNLTPLDANDGTAKALGYVADASKVDTAAHPTFKAGQRCATCAQYQGKQIDATARWTIFPRSTVPGGGVRQVWE